MPKIDMPIETLIEQLHGADWMARCDAARLLGQSGDPRAVDALLPDLEDPDWRVRRNATQALGALKDKRATEPLLRMLNDRTATVRERAIVALGRLKDPQALPALLEILLTNTRASYLAQQAIRKFGKKAVPAVLEAYQRTENGELLTLLVEMKYAGAMDFLLKLLHSQDEAKRLMAINELGKLGNKHAIPGLLEQLNDGNSSTQSLIVRALGRLDAVEALPALLDLLQDDDLFGPRSGVYHAVTEAFQKIAGIEKKIESAFPGKYPQMFNMGGAPFSLPEVSNLLGSDPIQMLRDKLPKTENRAEELAKSLNLPADLMRKTTEDLMWKFGVMFADARDASQERTRYLIELLGSGSRLERAAAALSLPWYVNPQSIEPLTQAASDADEVVRRAATWAQSALELVLKYRR